MNRSQGICLLAAGNAPLIALEGVITRLVQGVTPSQLALAWRTGDRRPLVLDYARACQQAARQAGIRRSGRRVTGQENHSLPFGGYSE